MQVMASPRICYVSLQATELDVQALRKEEKERLTMIKQLSSQRDHMSRLAAEWNLKLKYATREAAVKDFIVQVSHRPSCYCPKFPHRALTYIPQMSGCHMRCQHQQEIRAAQGWSDSGAGTPCSSASWSNTIAMQLTDILWTQAQMTLGESSAVQVPKRQRKDGAMQVQTFLQVRTMVKHHRNAVDTSLMNGSTPDSGMILVVQDQKRQRKDGAMQVQDFLQLYNMVKHQRNKFVTLVRVAGQSSAELTEKIRILESELLIMHETESERAAQVKSARSTNEGVRLERDKLRHELLKWVP